ncbi:MAG TPA: CHAD domain-containing protein [Blastocatellia bacterium]|nr:CHAD domain-containing protein [Blastocatellia bacterium]
MLDAGPGNQPALAEASSVDSPEQQGEPPQLPALAGPITGAPLAVGPRTLREVITAHIEALELHHRMVLQTTDVEAVHKTRVTTRRLQASLDLLQTESDPMDVRRSKRTLRRWRRRLSRVRNYDVFTALVESEFSARHRLRGPHLELLKAGLQSHRVRLMERDKGFFEKVRLADIASRLGLRAPGRAAVSAGEDRMAADGPLNPHVVAVVDAASSREAAPFPDENQIAARGASRIEQRLAEFLALAAQSHPSTDPRDLHQLRIAAKRLRYLFETVSVLGYGDAARALAWLKALQDRIGDWHDLEALEAEIVKLVSRRGFMREHLQQCGKLLEVAAVLQARKEAQVARLFPVKVPAYISATSHRLVRKLRPYRPRRARTVKTTE